MGWMGRRSHAKGQLYYAGFCQIQGELGVVIFPVLQAKDKVNLQKTELWK